MRREHVLNKLQSERLWFLRCCRLIDEYRMTAKFVVLQNLVKSNFLDGMYGNVVRLIDSGTSNDFVWPKAKENGDAGGR